MITLLKNGQAAFPALLRAIDAAQRTIFLHMFIWRNDSIGCETARAVLRAADRGVNVHIVKDRYGVICECCEENERSFFHRTQTFSEKMKIGFLKAFYNRDRSHAPAYVEEDGGALLGAILNHPNITLEDKNRFDHSKFIVIDDRVLFLGGMNIEDKENGRDYAGRAYRDYMIEIGDAAAVAAFLDRLRFPEKSSDGPFGLNVKRPRRYFGMEARYLQMIRHAEKELTIVMAYFSPVPSVMREILDAVSRGVEVKILCPARANFQDSLNRSTLNRLKKKSGGKVRVFLSPCMLHTKLLMTENEISFGSCNITKKAFGQLDELNLFLPRESEAGRAVAESASGDFAEAGEEVTGRLDCNAAWAFLEGFLV